ncbi:MAG: YfiR family protein, partial [Desulfobulbaceae bacterium]|nr:YfiR family protein [Desulfobulbaceae bacterium]
MRYAARKIFPKLWLTATLLLLGLTAIAPSTAVPGERVLPEYHLQAAYIVNFIRFTTWPESVFKDKDKDIVLRILGEDRFGSVLDIIDGENIKNRRLQVLRL